MRIARAFAIKIALTLGITGTLLSGSAAAFLSISPAASSASVVAAAPSVMHFG